MLVLPPLACSGIVGSFCGPPWHPTCVSFILSRLFLSLKMLPYKINFLQELF